jgi:hypothetical protein
MVKAFLEKIIPDFILYQWRKYSKNKEECRKNKLKQKIVNYLENISPPEMSNDTREIVNYLKYHSLSTFAYFYTEKYKPENVAVYRDNDKEMYYVLQEDKRLYFRKDWDEKRIQKCYSTLLIEQDVASPHRYESLGFYVSEGDAVVDAGVAEGNFALSIIEKVKKIYLFEADKAWIAALETTFAPWKEKVVIVNKYVSNKDKGKCITLDSFLGNEKIDFIKADIESAEPLLLAGAKTLLSRQTPLKAVLCTYHKHNDAEILNRMLTEKGFHTEFSSGYIIFHYETYDKLKPPYLRKGVIRGIKR